MTKRLPHLLLSLLFSLLLSMSPLAFAAVDANKATQAELETVKGIGPAISGKILDERKKGSFKDWPDLIERVSGVGEGNAAKFSGAGLTVGGSAYKGAPAAAAPKTAAKGASKPAATDAPASAAKPTKEEKAKAKADAKAASAPAKK